MAAVATAPKASKASRKPQRKGPDGWEKPHRQLVADVEKDTFFREWIARNDESWQSYLDFEQESTLQRRDEVAQECGFRTWRQHREYLQHARRVLAMFVSEKAFLALWEILRRLDREKGWGPDLYGPHNGGAPMKLLRAIEVWYKQPKLTKSQHAQHHKRIERLCGELLILLEQVTPSGAFDLFRTLNLDPRMTEGLFRAMATPEWRREQFRNDAAPIFLSSHLADIGLTPLWAVRNIAASARIQGHDVLPPKVKAKTALRTYFIRELSEAIWHYPSVTSGPSVIRDAAFAEIVALAVGMDCSIDDVRKAFKQYELEKTRFQNELMVHCEIDPGRDDAGSKRRGRSPSL